jgi:hypothetical protein
MLLTESVLIIGGNAPALDAASLSVLTNKAAVSVSQDPLGVQVQVFCVRGRCSESCTRLPRLAFDFGGSMCGEGLLERARSSMRRWGVHARPRLYFLRREWVCGCSSVPRSPAVALRKLFCPSGLCVHACGGVCAGSAGCGVSPGQHNPWSHPGHEHSCGGALQCFAPHSAVVRWKPHQLADPTTQPLLCVWRRMCVRSVRYPSS